METDISDYMNKEIIEIINSGDELFETKLVDSPFTQVRLTDLPAK